MRPPVYPVPGCAMRYARLVLTAVISLCYGTLLWSSDIEQIRSTLKNRMHDTARMGLLVKLGDALTDQGSYEEAKVSLNEALLLAQRMRHFLYELKALKILGVVSFYQGNNKDAIRYWELALAIAVKTKNQNEYYGIRMNMANVMLVNADYLAAQQAYYEVLHWAETNRRHDQVSKCMINLASLYSALERYDSTRYYLLHSLRTYEKYMTPHDKANVLNNLAVMDVNESKYRALEHSAQTLLDYSKKENLKRFIGSAFAMFGIAKMHNGNRVLARLYMDSALVIQTEEQDDREKTSNLHWMARLNLDAALSQDAEYLRKFCQGSRAIALKEAHSLLDTVIVFFRLQGELEQLSNAYEVLSAVAKAQGNPAAALDYHIQFKRLSDSLFNIERDKRLTEKAMMYAFSKKEAAARAEQEKKDQRQRFVRNGISGILVFVLLFLAVVWKQRNSINLERRRSEDLLLNILPKEVAGELKEKGSAAAKSYDRCTVLFTDFKGFTQLSERVTPEVLVEELNHCFKAFDAIIDQYGIEKIKTIGDAYMAVGGLPDPHRGAPADVVKAALEMQEFMKGYKEDCLAKGKPFFEMRAGIHTGPVVAGIVGLRKFQYDIWGDTVNTASRMESSGEPGKVNISETTYKQVKSGFHCTPRGKIQAKNKGEMEMYFVESMV